MSPRESTGRGAALGERLVVVFLLLAVAALSYIWWWVIPQRRAGSDIPFDLHNPLLTAQVGDCVEIESTARPGERVCLSVVEPGVVLRPREGPDVFGPDDGVRRLGPYLACRLRYPPAGGTCEDAAGAPSELDRFDLNAFGLPASAAPVVETIRPLWVRRGGREHFVYEVGMTVYGGAGGTMACYIDPDAPVLTGTLYRTYAKERLHQVVFRPVAHCVEGP